MNLNLTGTVTGIGSLPFVNPEPAVRAVAELSPEIPFWPQLPQLSERETAIGQSLGILKNLIEPRNTKDKEGYGYRVKEGCIASVVSALHRSTGEVTSENAVGFGALEEAFARGFFPSARAVKGQTEGPVTLATYLFYNDRPFLADSALFAAIAFHVSQIVCWQIDRLKFFGLPVLMFVDEPALCLDVPAAVPVEQRLHALAGVLESARVRGALAGLHCCAARPFERMCRARPDILSFDAHEGLELFFADRDARAFLRNGGTVAYGMVPTLPRPGAIDPVALFTRWLTAAALAGDPQELARRAMVTATCGLGLLDRSAVADSFQVAQRVGKLIRRFAGVPAL